MFYHVSISFLGAKYVISVELFGSVHKGVGDAYVALQHKRSPVYIFFRTFGWNLSMRLEVV